MYERSCASHFSKFPLTDAKIFCFFFLLSLKSFLARFKNNSYLFDHFVQGNVYSKQKGVGPSLGHAQFFIIFLEQSILNWRV